MSNIFQGLFGVAGIDIGNALQQGQQYTQAIAQQQYGGGLSGIAASMAQQTAQQTQREYMQIPHLLDTNDGTLVFYNLLDSLTIPNKKALLGKFYED